MAICDSCGKGEGTHHLTVTVSVFGPVATHRKTVQFWLCSACELANQQVMAQDPLIRQRVARRMTVDSDYMSRWRAWRDRKDTGLPARALEGD